MPDCISQFILTNVKNDVRKGFEELHMNPPIYGHIRALMLVSIIVTSDTLDCYQCPMCDLCSYEKPWSQIIMGYHLLIWITQTSFPVYQSNGQIKVKKIREEQRFHFSMLMQNMILKHLLGILGKLKVEKLWIIYLFSYIVKIPESQWQRIDSDGIYSQVSFWIAFKIVQNWKVNSHLKIT